MRNSLFPCLLVAASMIGTVKSAEESTAFGYQGRLTKAGVPAGGPHELRLVLYDAATGGTLVAGPVTNLVVASENGVFSTYVDFGVPLPRGTSWLDLAVRLADEESAFVPLDPRQPVLPVPQAVRASRADEAATARSLAAPPNSGAPSVIIGSNPPDEPSELSGGVTWLDADGAVAGHLVAGQPDRLDFRLNRPLQVTGGGLVLGAVDTANAGAVTNLLEVLGTARFQGIPRFDQGIRFADGSLLESAGVIRQPNVLWVSTEGDDETARRGDPSKPWSSLGIAISNALSGDVVLVLPGRYLVSTVAELGPERTKAPIRIVGLTNFTLAGFGGVPEIYAPDFGDILQVASCRELNIRNLHFRSDASYLAAPPHGQSAGICLRPDLPQNSHVWIEGCRFTGVPHAITTFAAPAVATDYLTVRNCYFQDCGWTTGVPLLGQDGGALTGFGNHLRFVNNVLDRAIRGVEFYRFPGDPSHTNALISDNIFRNYWDCAICSFDDGGDNLASLDGVIIVNNIFEDAPPEEPGGEISGSAAVLVNSGRGITVRGNVVRGGKLYGIKVSALTGPLEHVDISENQVSGVVGRGIQVTDYGPGVSHVRVTDNRLTGNYGGGILAQGQYLDLTSNDISHNYPAGIRLTATESGRPTTDGRVFANTLVLNTAAIVQENTVRIEVGSNFVIDPPSSTDPDPETDPETEPPATAGPKPDFHPNPAQLRSRRAEAWRRWTSNPEPAPTPTR